MKAIGDRVNTFIAQTNDALTSKKDGPKAVRWVDTTITAAEHNSPFRSAAKALLGTLFAEQTDISVNEAQLLRQGLEDLNDVGSLSSLSTTQLKELLSIVDKVQTSINRVYLSDGGQRQLDNDLTQFKRAIDQSIDISLRRENAEGQVQSWNSAPATIKLPTPSSRS